MSVEQIARVESTTLGIEDHGIFTAFLHCTFGGSGQGVGGYGLDEPVHEDGKFIGRRGTAYGMEWITRCIKACGVDSWEKIKGRTIMVYREDDSWSSKIIGIGPLPTERGTPFMFDDLREMAEAS